MSSRTQIRHFETYRPRAHGESRADRRGGGLAGLPWNSQETLVFRCAYRRRTFRRVCALMTRKPPICLREYFMTQRHTRQETRTPAMVRSSQTGDLELDGSEACLKQSGVALNENRRQPLVRSPTLPL